jgi:CubicO group peptidase (beta-lactamase class C family)
MKPKNLLLIFVLFVFPIFVYAQNLNEKINEIEAYAEKARSDWNVPGVAMAIVKDDKVVFARGFGVRELGKTEKVDENTLFAIASNSKAFTTASLAMLVDEGKIKWNDKVSQYLPEFQMFDPYISRELTIRDLVSHRSGLGTFSGDLLWYDTSYTTDEILRRVRYLKPTTSFRSAYGYQNLMFMAAARVLEKVSGKTWANFVQERILTPLRMNNTKTSVKQFKTGDNMAMPHNEHSGKLASFPHGNVDNAAGAAGINASVADLENWMRLQLGRGTFEGKKFFSEQQSWAMWQPNIMMPLSDASMKFNPSRHFNAYGMGWNLSDYQGRKVVSHGGGLDGMISQTALMPEENLGVVVLTNSESSLAPVMTNKVFDVFLGVPKRDWSKEILDRTNLGKQTEIDEAKKVEASRILNTKPTLPISNYVGTYSSQMYGDVTISEENGHLVLRLVPAPNFVADLEHWHYDTFQIKWQREVVYNFPKGFVTFTLDGNGKTDELKINQPNSDFWFYELDLKRIK